MFKIPDELDFNSFLEDFRHDRHQSNWSIIRRNSCSHGGEKSLQRIGVTSNIIGIEFKKAYDYTNTSLSQL